MVLPTNEPCWGSFFGVSCGLKGFPGVLLGSRAVCRSLKSVMIMIIVTLMMIRPPKLLPAASRPLSGTDTRGHCPLSSSSSSLALYHHRRRDGKLLYPPSNLPTFQPFNIPTFQTFKLPAFQPSNLPTFSKTNKQTNKQCRSVKKTGLISSG